MRAEVFVDETIGNPGWVVRYEDPACGHEVSYPLGIPLGTPLFKAAEAGLKEAPEEITTAVLYLRERKALVMERDGRYRWL